MSEQQTVQRASGGNPLVSERGATTVKSVVVQRIAGLAAREVEGVHMGGGAARTASRLSGGRTGSQDQTRGVSVDVGRTEVAIDLTMAVDYGKDILRTVNRVRDRISARVEPLTGLDITELNVTVTDIVLPEDEEDGGPEEDEDRTQSLPAAAPATQERQQPTRETPRDTDQPSEHRGPLAENGESDQTTELRLDKEGDGERRES